MKAEYITEQRGGYDEWSDTYISVVGLRIRTDSGDIMFESRGRSFDDLFVSESGTELEVELPQRERIGEEITVELYSPSYDFYKVSLDEFNEKLQSGEIKTTV